MKKSLMFGIVIVLIIVGFFIFQAPNTSASYETINSIEGDVEIYKSVTCGCCGIYTNYFDSKTAPNVEAINVQDPRIIKSQYGVPPELESCHTTIIDGYFVEGHIPLEAIEKLLTDKPDVAGIAMPGMPAGSPGMPGQKNNDFIIYSVNHNGSYQEFMRI